MALALVTGGNRGIGPDVADPASAAAGPTGGFFRDGSPVPW
jgi:hypothetical protein